MSTAAKGKAAGKPKKAPMEPRPSSSVLLISPTNQILLLHRVQTSSSFASAHVFPGGNVSEFHDGRAPEPGVPERHVDNKVYRMAAVRETFEESGILLAKDKKTGELLSVNEEERESGRKLIHGGKVSFPTWLEEKGGVADIDGLIPFTRWITPPQVPKRFTTQMYLYFLPLSVPTNYKDDAATPIGPLPINAPLTIHTPKHDGGVEHTAARFLAPSAWLDQANTSNIILYPPQYFLLTMVAQFLKPTWDAYSTIQLQQQRRELQQFVAGTDRKWADACISPIMKGSTKDGRQMLSLEYPGNEVKDFNRTGLSDYVVVVGRKGNDPTPMNVEVKTRREVPDLLAKPSL